MNKTLKTTGLSMALALCVAGSTNAAEPALPDTLSWTAYNVGSSGYGQSVAIGKALQDAYGVTLRVVPAKNDVSRVVPVVSGQIDFAAAGSGVFYAVEGVLGWAKPELGPQSLQMVMSSTGRNCLALGTAADANIKTAADLKGKRVPWVIGSPALQTNVTAFLAYGDLTWDDVIKVEVSGFDAAWKLLLNDQADAMTSFTTGGGTELNASPRGLHWLSTPHSETENWVRMQAVAPHMAQRVATAGTNISDDNSLECGGFPYPILVTASDQDPALVENMASAITQQFDNFSSAEPSASGWAADRQNFQWVLPYHQGAVAFWKSQGMWSDAADAHNAYLVERQAVIAAAWDALEDKSADGFKERWMLARFNALTAADMPAVWEK
ncbi:TAXI family TRAP transporter solute-binding subunit (plasmid) [Parasedimentitalea marina]|uniref:TAXI family TRAP transporter solute-binding subunit n=1 Tax=Parasedimentitalea marina TaxID=2483033 RepID=A0A3T0N9X7_9RHOB|nr:TAXI family TRAP transporter solute-binding subunit [Parasedimentitalea marina]AZV80854.1 TAXI family TRAP transporter solute-binding subunit [Parasedimentitalea marina]